MAEYIDRERFIKDKREWYCKDCDRRKSTDGMTIYAIGEAPCKSCGVTDMLDELEDYPAANVEKVVRCRDCRFWHTKLCWAKHDLSKNDFCSFGAKMDEKVL